jgi:ribulose-bisphosphate carboxylase large chain
MSRLRVTYRVRARPGEIESLARNLALEQSVEVAAEVVRDRYVADEVMGRVADVRPRDDGTYDVDLLLASATTGGDAAQLLNMLFGNSSLHAHVELVDAELPDDLAARFEGPRFGIAGWRDALAVHDRALTCAALKPQGLPVEALAALCRTLAANGVDVVKDDHGLADQAYSPFAERVAACERAIREANRETGRRAIYAPSLVGSPAALAHGATVLRNEGVRAVLVAPALVGMPAFGELVRGLGVPVLAHPAYAGAVRVAPPLILGKLFRMLGADATIYPNWGGRFAYSREECAAIADAARDPLHAWRPALPVPAGGLAVERVPELVDFYGRDVMLLIGGSLLMAGDDLAARTRAFVRAVEQRGAQATPGTQAREER